MSSSEDSLLPQSIMPRSHGIAREGYPFLLGALMISLAAFLFGGAVAGGVSLVLPLFVANFFRDPNRVVPEGEDLVVSPADGKVISIGEVEEERYLNRRLRRVCIFMSVTNVHVNRVPASGRIKAVRYHPGKFLIGFAEKASLDNEQNAVIIEQQSGREILFVQIAGFVARRIVCYLTGGEKVARGERFGLIRFGSRVDVYLPLDVEILVREGQKVKAGETVLGKMGHNG